MIVDGNVASMSSVSSVSGFFTFVIGSIVKWFKKWNEFVAITAKGCLNPRETVYIAVVAYPVRFQHG